MKNVSQEINDNGRTYIGNFTEFSIKPDKADLKTMYDAWRNLCQLAVKFNARSINLPDAISECGVCLALDLLRTNGSISGLSTSFDAFDATKKQRVQIKATSVSEDLTSFGPRSVWDVLYFADFFREGLWDGSFDIYLIPNNLIYNQKVNATQTMKDQQLQGKRPRFSIKREIIKARSLKPFKTYRL